MRILTIVGARPQFIKAATVSRAIGRLNSAQPDRRQVEEIIVHTGQHYDENMSDVFFRDLDIPSPEYNLCIGSGLHGEQTGKMLAGIEQIILDRRPDCILVYGDTNSTLAGALAASKLHIPVAHVEAGLRSFNRRMPEETNRVLTDHLSRWLFCPTTTAVANLAKESIVDGVHLVGDVMYDGILFYHDRLPRTAMAQLGLQPKNFLLATVHRAENTDDPERLVRIVDILNNLSSPDRPVVLALHPRTKKAIADRNLRLSDALRIIPPASYFTMIELLANCAAVVTDSGGVQKEAFFLQAPCLTLRDETEWVETVACNANRLVGSSHRLAVEALAELDAGTWQLDFTARPYGDGKAAEAILTCLLNDG